MNRKLLFAAGALGLGTLYLATRPRRRFDVAVREVRSTPIQQKWTAMGGEARVGRPTSIMAILPDCVAVQNFTRADGDRQTIYAGRTGVFVVRGGFRGLYEGREGLFGLPTSDEYATKISGAKMLGVAATIDARAQTFERGRMIWFKERNRLLAYAVTKLAMQARAGLQVVYDSKPPPGPRKSWYEQIGVGEVLLSTPMLAFVGMGVLTAPLTDAAMGVVNYVVPGAGAPAFDIGRVLGTWTCDGAKAVDKATGTGDPAGNGLCRKYATLAPKVDAAKAAKSGAKYAAGASEDAPE